ncbi:hydrogenase maturation protein HypF [Saccharothrix ecbatanensis]|uniref:Carbamoyltransferase n=1 Tax=Saccharothrix ecbatanensis TaxID=1105145 RepID=A0A7W9HHR7_9PSEU|nr:carbamoyltransferase HypF [Saccharothrix ecbatanensis]MBB5802440.1 hydrogenase maturation protein HypF [Saccharothrix ecbatanensis]
MGLRRTIRIGGIVQGVGFRPFVHRTAAEHRLGGWANNGVDGVTVCVEGAPDDVRRFTRDLAERPPPLAVIDSFDYTDEPVDVPAAGFRIRPSDPEGRRRALVPADTHLCGPCLTELFDPADRRHRYPLINCTDCGPRFSIILDVPYDRPLTTMAPFPMCADCQAEYDSVTDRRYHAQPNACPVCGPRVRLADHDRVPLTGGDPVEAAAALLRDGLVVAVQAHGGYQLVVDAADNKAVARLRKRKDRGNKPFAVLVADVGEVRRYARVSDAEADLLCSPARPIVLLRAHPDAPLSVQVAPGLGVLGVMLPSTPLQHLLLASGFPVLVATSGNAPGEPMARTAESARRDLGRICDAYLEHDRRIHSRVDDSIARVVPLAGGPRPQLVRRARGYVPRPVRPPFDLPPVLAVGAELKNTACYGSGRRLVLTQHLGDLGTERTRSFFDSAVAHLGRLLEVDPVAVAHDLHPDFHGTRWAARSGLRTIAVQHHHAHLASCLVDNGVDEPAIGVVFDGTGLGEDGTIWGGEFLVGDYVSARRRGHLSTFRLPGGDRAVREPDRVALALLHAAYGREAADLPLAAVRDRDPFERDVLLRMCERGVGAPVTSSAGRLFDGFGALLGVCRSVGYDAEAAIRLEEVLGGDHTPVPPWPVRVDDVGGLQVVDVRPWVRAVVDELATTPVPVLSRRFHSSLAAAIGEVCGRLRRETGLGVVALSGGVFLNQYLSVRVDAELTAAGFRVLHHGAIPPSDGGIAAGQAVIAGARLRAEAR